MTLEKINLDFAQAKELLHEGDILLFRGSGIASFFIQRASEGEYSHVGVASCHGTNGGKMWECVEFREWKGGRVVNLERYVKQHSGRIDVYRPVSSKKSLSYDPETNIVREVETGFNGKGVTNIMRRMTGLPYGWKRILWIAQHKIAFLRLFYSMDSVVDDSTKDPVYPVCSTALAYANSRVNYDILHHRADKATEPSDFARSPLTHYLFTLK